MPKITRKRIYSQQEIEPRRSGFSGCNGRSTIDRSISIHLRVPRPNSKFQDNGPIFAAWSKSNIRAAVSGSQLLSRLILSNEAARRDHSLALRVAPGGPSPRGAFFFFFWLVSITPPPLLSWHRECLVRFHNADPSREKRLLDSIPSKGTSSVGFLFDRLPRNAKTKSGCGESSTLFESFLRLRLCF